MKSMTDCPQRYPERPIEDAQAPWWIARVKSRQEKQFAFDLLQGGVEFFLPLYSHVVVNEKIRRKRTYKLPLFPGYVCFSQITPGGIYKTGRVVDIIKISNQKRFVSELSRVYRALEQQYPLEPFNTDLQVHEKVVICTGPLSGMRGQVVRLQNSCKVVIEVYGLGHALVEIAANQVERLPEE